MVLVLAPGSPRPRVLPVPMDSHSDHMGQGTGQRQHSPSSNRHLMMPPYPPSLQPQHHYQSAEIPSTIKPSPVPVTTASLFPPESASSSNRRAASDNAGVHLQTSPMAMNGGSSPDSHTGSANYSWSNNDPWSSNRSPHQQQQHQNQHQQQQHQYGGGNRTPGALNPGSFFQQNGMHPMSTTMASNLSPITATTPADTHPSFHSSPATTMSHLSIDHATSHSGASSNGILPPFRQNTQPYSSRPTPPLSRSSSFPAPAGSNMPGAFVPGISSMLPMTSTMPSSRPGLAAPLSPLGSSPGGGPPNLHHGPGPGRLSDYASQHHQHQHQHQHQPQPQYMHNLANSGGPMALVSHYGPSSVTGPYGSQFNGMMFQQQQRTPEKPHQCDQCTTAFTRNHDLKRHKRIHWAVKPYPCDGCDKAFSRKDALKRHKMVKCCGDKDKNKKEGSPNSVGSQGGHSGGSSPEDNRRMM